MKISVFKDFKYQWIGMTCLELKFLEYKKCGTEIICRISSDGLDLKKYPKINPLNEPEILLDLEFNYSRNICNMSLRDVLDILYNNDIEIEIMEEISDEISVY